jgi:hypothetical protein
MTWKHAVGDVLERFPSPGLEAVAHPQLLTFAGAVMGPVVQLDSAVLAGDPPVDTGRLGEPVRWHRDRFGFFPLGVYTRPLSMVYFIYLQDMTQQVGPLRVIPGSHTDPTEIADENLAKPHPREVLLEAAAGEVVAIHHNLLHSGTRNVSTAERRFLGFIYNISALTHEDNFHGPNCQALAAAARRTGDRRTQRLLGQDPLIFPRQNSGFTHPEAADWTAWRQEDDLHAQCVAAEARLAGKEQP